MSASLTTIGGKPALEIPAADGEVWTYWFRLLPPLRGLWAVELTRLDQGLPVETYLVQLWAHRWECSCPHAKYRRGLCNQSGGCKHTLAARELRAILESIGVGS